MPWLLWLLLIIVSLVEGNLSCESVSQVGHLSSLLQLSYAALINHSSQQEESTQGNLTGHNQTQVLLQSMHRLSFHTDHEQGQDEGFGVVRFSPEEANDIALARADEHFQHSALLCPGSPRLNKYSGAWMLRKFTYVTWCILTHIRFPV